ncbi:hypothetical protein ABZ446_46250 [Streptomyces sp. NPDC005813]|uniref:hypothetical protein n=1 Tax=Streptomyces sp. NPDC005813 TaxID=3155592 RepID=UPI0034069C45
MPECVAAEPSRLVDADYEGQVLLLGADRDHLDRNAPGAGRRSPHTPPRRTRLRAARAAGRRDDGTMPDGLIGADDRACLVKAAAASRALS